MRRAHLTVSPHALGDRGMHEAIKGKERTMPKRVFRARGVDRDEIHVKVEDNCIMFRRPGHGEWFVASHSGDMMDNCTPSLLRAIATAMEAAEQ